MKNIIKKIGRQSTLCAFFKGNIKHKASSKSKNCPTHAVRPTFILFYFYEKADLNVRQWLTRVRVVCQAALPPSQCCCRGCKRDAVIILVTWKRKENIHKFSHVKEWWTWKKKYHLCINDLIVDCGNWTMFTIQNSPAVFLSAASVGHHSRTPEAEAKQEIC